jgi:hypothetical protein
MKCPPAARPTRTGSRISGKVAERYLVAGNELKEAPKVVHRDRPAPIGQAVGHLAQLRDGHLVLLTGAGSGLVALV